MRKLTILWALVVVAALVLSGCTAVGPSSGAAEAGATEAGATEATADTGLLGTIQEPRAHHCRHIRRLPAV